MRRKKYNFCGPKSTLYQKVVRNNFANIKANVAQCTIDTQYVVSLYIHLVSQTGQIYTCTYIHTETPHFYKDLDLLINFCASLINIEIDAQQLLPFSNHPHSLQNVARESKSLYSRGSTGNTLVSVHNVTNNFVN